MYKLICLTVVLFSLHLRSQTVQDEIKRLEYMMDTSFVGYEKKQGLDSNTADRLNRLFETKKFSKADSFNGEFFYFEDSSGKSYNHLHYIIVWHQGAAWALPKKEGMLHSKLMMGYKCFPYKDYDIILISETPNRKKIRAIMAGF